MTWWNDDSIQIVEIDGELYALYGWNGEKWVHCWKCIDRFTAVLDGKEYEVIPIHAGFEDDYETIGYELS